ncbi:MAG: extracellular solute-binding protein [Faecousia sp.]
MKLKKWISWILVLMLVFSIPGGVLPVSAEQTGTGGAAADWELGIAAADTSVSYSEYLAAHGPVVAENCPDTEIVIRAADYAALLEAQAYVAPYMGKDSCLYWDKEGGTVTWNFTVEQEGYYQLEVCYAAIAGKNYDMIADFLLDGEAPCANVKNVNLHRKFIDETYFGLDSNEFKANLAGDQLRPELVEQYDWQTMLVTDAKSQYTGPMYFYLTAGEHTLGMALKEECLAIDSFTFKNTSVVPTYAEMLQQWGGTDTSGHLLTYEAEKSYLKNDITLFATYDTAYAHVSPASSTNVYYNTIGKNTWKKIGQEITWEFEVPEDGYYELAFKVKQNSKSNSYSARSISIDGAPLYREMEVQKFEYKSKWYVQTLQDAQGNATKVYLTAGRHVLGMTAVMDEEMASVLRGVTEVTAELQGWYREIIKITGFNADSSRVTIDMNRDFDLEKNIPGLLEGFRSCKEKLDGYYSRIEQIEGISVSSASILKEMSTLLDGLIKHPGKIAKRLETFRSDISTMATWTIDMQEQPLVMDKFFVYSPDVSTPKVGSNFFAQLWYRLMLFFHSFSMSTTSISGSSEVEAGDTTIRVWISTADITTTGASSGRDQAIILKKLIDESFTSQTGIRVEVSLVGGSDTLVQAVLAGEGPDAALFTSVNTPVNLAMRGMLLELSQFEGCQEVLTQFTDSAVVPFWYKDGLYALPETQNFNMIFYRTDIFDELGLQPPKTWEEFYQQVILLSNHNYMVGIPQNQNTFETFLYQAGTTFYTEDLSRSTFDQPEALEAFRDWTNLYTKYSLSLTFDFFNRFRSGEMAMGIMPYNQVNYLYSAAPELDGLWDMAVTPGTVQPDGSINYVETTSSTGCIALADTKHPQETFKFLKWWVSAEAQADFGTQVEQTLGIAARYGTANILAFEEIPWTNEQAAVLRDQRDHTVAIEQIPGNYYIARNLAFAFRAVVYNHANLRETLYKYNIEINKELARKQEEFSY